MFTFHIISSDLSLHMVLCQESFEYSIHVHRLTGKEVRSEGRAFEEHSFWVVFRTSKRQTHLRKLHLPGVSVEPSFTEETEDRMEIGIGIVEWANWLKLSIIDTIIDHDFYYNNITFYIIECHVSNTIPGLYCFDAGGAGPSETYHAEALKIPKGQEDFLTECQILDSSCFVVLEILRSE